VRPETARVEGAKPDAAKPAPLRPEAARPELVRPDAGKAEVPKPDPVKAQPARPVVEQKTESAATEAARAAAVLDGKASYALQLGVFSDAANVAKLRARAKELGFPSFTEEVKLADGQTRTRVKVGPFASRASAESAQRKLEAAGLRSMLSPRP
jgi:DedD protein